MPLVRVFCDVRKGVSITISVHLVRITRSYNMIVFRSISFHCHSESAWYSKLPSVFEKHWLIAALWLSTTETPHSYLAHKYTKSLGNSHGCISTIACKDFLSFMMSIYFPAEIIASFQFTSTLKIVCFFFLLWIRSRKNVNDKFSIFSQFAPK